MDPAPDADWSAPALTVIDEPATSWRGLHLDSARHFQPKEFILKFIDVWGDLDFRVNNTATFRDLPWTPNLSYRYASFSGDDPKTSTYEGFDSPLSSGLDTWVQGANVRKVASNNNLDTHRIRLNLAASPKLSLSFDYFWLLANEAAGNPRPIAQELDLGIRWSIQPNLFFAGIAFPDDHLEQQAGTDLDSWTSLQASLFWNF